MQRSRPTCGIAAEVVAHREIDALPFIVTVFRTRCPDKAREYSSGLEFFASKNGCGYRTTFLWTGNEQMPEASIDSVVKIIGQLRFWN
jgi:hypothetical protein